MPERSPTWDVSLPCAGSLELGAKDQWGHQWLAKEKQTMASHISFLWTISF
jgi:hypothetical protein